MTGPRLSVCLATWNGAQYLRPQIDSILRQLEPGDELVVSDDGSTDDTLQILDSYGARLRRVGDGRAGGVVRNFERALAAANGELVALSDQDDVWLDGRVALIKERLDHVALLMMNGDVVDADLVPSGQDILGFVSFHSGFLRTFAATKYVGCCMAFRRELLQVALPFPMGIRWHDWYLALIGELLFSCECNSRKTLLFRRHGANASTTGQRSRSSLWEKIRTRFWMGRALIIACLRSSRRRRRSVR